MNTATGSRPGRLSGRVAIVTGAGSRDEGIGNGRATAILMAREGARLALIDRVPEWAEATRRMITAEGGEALVLEADVADHESCRRAVAATAEALGPPRILVNNVGVHGPLGTALEVDPDEFDQGLRVNVTSMVMMARHTIPHMIAAGGGAIVNLASVAGLRGGHPNLLYAVSKGAIVQLTRSMAAHHGRQGIRVNCIAPGYVYTPMVWTRGMTPELRERRRLRSLLQTEGEGWDVGHAAVYLASDEARWVTGVCLPVDAGASAGDPDLPTPVKEGG